MRSQHPRNIRSEAQLRRIDCVSTIIREHNEHEQRVLLVWNSDWRTPSWSLPGGAREPGESLREAAAREVREETGLDVAVSDLVDVHEIIGVGGRIHLVIFTFEGRVTGGSLIPDGAGEPDLGGVSAARWFSVEDAAAMPSVARLLGAEAPRGRPTSCTADHRLRPPATFRSSETVRGGRA